MRFGRLIAFIGASLFACAALAQQGPIKIGMSMPQTGSLGAGGQAALVALRMWVDDVNGKGGLLGRKIEFIVYDDQTNPANTPGIYTKLLDVDKVDLVVGPYATAMIAPAMPVVMQKGKVFIGLFGLAARGVQARGDLLVVLRWRRDVARAELELGGVDLTARVGLHELLRLLLESGDLVGQRQDSLHGAARGIGRHGAHERRPDDDPLGDAAERPRLIGASDPESDRDRQPRVGADRRDPLRERERIAGLPPGDAGAGQAIDEAPRPLHDSGQPVRRGRGRHQHHGVDPRVAQAALQVGPDEGAVDRLVHHGLVPLRRHLGLDGVARLPRAQGRVRLRRVVLDVDDRPSLRAPEAEQVRDARLRAGVVPAAPLGAVEPLLHVDHEEGGVVGDVHASILRRRDSTRAVNACRSSSASCRPARRYAGPMILEHAILPVVPGREADFEAAFAEAVAAFRAVGDRRSEATAVSWLADVAIKLGDHERARRLGEEALAMLRELGDRQAAAVAQAEIEEEAEEHQVFIHGNAVVGPATAVSLGGIVEHAYADAESTYGDNAVGEDLPVGLANTITTIKPGGYDSPIGHRPPHIHFDIRGATHRNIAQLYFPEDAEANAKGAKAAAGDADRQCAAARKDAIKKLASNKAAANTAGAALAVAKKL